MTQIIVRRRRRKKGGRPPKVESHRHLEHVSARMTPAEHLVFGRVLAARAALGLPGAKNASEWIRASLHEQAVAFGVDLPAGYAEVRLVRDLLPQRPEPSPVDDEEAPRARARRGLRSSERAKA